LLPALQQLGWSIVFRDDVATLLTNSDLGRRDVN
jgi:hypothetical protein